MVDVIDIVSYVASATTKIRTAYENVVVVRELQQISFLTRTLYESNYPSQTNNSKSLQQKINAHKINFKLLQVNLHPQKLCQRTDSTQIRIIFLLPC